MSEDDRSWRDGALIVTEEQFSAIVKRGPRAQSSVYEQTLKTLERAVPSQWLEWAYYFYLIMQAQNLHRNAHAFFTAWHRRTTSPVVVLTMVLHLIGPNFGEIRE